MQRALVSVDGFIQALNGPSENYLVALQRILNEADLELDRAERGEAA